MRDYSPWVDGKWHNGSKLLNFIRPVPFSLAE